MILFLFGCQPNTKDTGSLLPLPSYDLMEYQEQIQSTLELGIPNSEDARSAYLNWMQHGDNDCPGSDYLLQGVIEPCTSTSGYIFSGLVSFSGTTNTLYFPDSYEVGADCYILSPNGERFVGAGDFSYLSSGEISKGTIESTIRGTWESEDQDDWLAKDNSIWITNNISWEQEEWSSLINGAYHLDETSIRFQNVSVGSNCTGGIGSVEIRDPNGYWLKIELDPSCRGCGLAHYQGQAQGEVCLDLFPTIQNEYHSLRVNQ
jgi:hypothetical protein